MKIKYHLMAVVLALNSCHPTPSADPVAPHPTPVPTDVEMCDAAEVHLIALGCPEGQPTKRGTRFADICRELSAAGIFPNPRCLANVKSCSEVDVCTGTTNPMPVLPN